MLYTWGAKNLGRKPIVHQQYCTSKARLRVKRRVVSRRTWGLGACSWLVNGSNLHRSSGSERCPSVRASGRPLPMRSDSSMQVHASSREPFRRLQFRSAVDERGQLRSEVQVRAYYVQCAGLAPSSHGKQLFRDCYEQGSLRSWGLWAEVEARCCGCGCER